MKNVYRSCVHRSNVRRSASAIFLRAGSIALAALASGSCVAQSRYDEALGEAKYFQRQYQDLSSFHGQLEARGAREFCIELTGDRSNARLS